MKDITVHDIHENQPIVALYEPPTDLTPGEVGLLYDNKFEDREITATIIDLAMRGFMAIRKVSRRHLFGDYTVYEFELLREDAGVLELKGHEQAVLNGLFGVVGSVQMDKMQAEVTNARAREKIASYYKGTEHVSMIGNRVCIDELRPYFFQYVSQAYTATHAQLQRAGYFTRGSSLIGWLALLVGAALIGGAILQTAYSQTVVVIAWLIGIICLIIGSGLLAGASSFARRATLGDKAKRYLDGFILYLKTAEVDRLAHIQAPKTVEQRAEGIKLYKTYLPYAIALGLESEWSDKFQAGYTQSSTWLMGGTDAAATDLQTSVAAALQQAKAQ
jgi:hypothetical protein